MSTGSNSLRGKAAIIGFGDSYCRKDERKTAFRLAMEATAAALQDAGIRKSEIDGLLTGRGPISDPRPQWNNVFASYAKMTPRYSTEITTHAAGMVGMIRHAALAVTSGTARFVLCVGADAAAGLTDPRSEAASIDLDPEFERPYGPILPTMYAQIASRLMHEYGMTEEHMAAVSVQCQNWATHHPYSAKGHKGRISIDDVLKSPMVASPLRLWNCAIWGPPGTGGAVIVTTSEIARSLNMTPLYLLGAGECQTHEYLTDRMGLRESSLAFGTLPNITTSACGVAAKAAYDMAGLAPTDMDVVQTASNFSHMVLMSLAELGFTNMHEAGDFVMSGATDIGGTIPANTNGGWLSFGQPGVSCVMDSVIETVRQLRGSALGVQVPDARIGMVHAAGGTSACHNALILGTER